MAERAILSEKKQGVDLNLFNLTLTDSQRIKDAIDACGGNVLTLVHPVYDLHFMQFGEVGVTLEDICQQAIGKQTLIPPQLHVLVFFMRARKENNLACQDAREEAIILA